MKNSKLVIENGRIVLYVAKSDPVSVIFQFRPYQYREPHRCRYCGGLTVTDDNNCFEKYPDNGNT